MDEVDYVVRVDRLRKLIDAAPFHGKQVAFASAVGIVPDYISRCLSGKKKIGELIARRIEVRIGLPRGWMDIPLPRGGDALSQSEALWLELRTHWNSMDDKARSNLVMVAAGLAQANPRQAPKIAANH